jgi:dihydrofolate synthase/folylpolyglutamate synthase
MNYQETIDFLFTRFPVFEKTGGSAYKPGLERIRALSEHFGAPHTKFPTVHIAGTNGKGSSSHLTASVLQCAGYKTGLFTSPHLKSFTERIRINGLEIQPQRITDFVNKHQDFLDKFQASFFEITTLMAFCFFAEDNVDIAVMETGMGGLYDSTNIILPEAALITNISYDHMQYLGDTLEKIAYEKAGIIKKDTPVVISEYQPESWPVFVAQAEAQNAPLVLAEKACRLENVRFEQGQMKFDAAIEDRYYQQLQCGLGGFYQGKNCKGVLMLLHLLQQKGWNISEKALRQGFEEVVTLSGLKGRWYFLQQHPAVLCDTAHNEAGIRYVTEQLKTLTFQKLYIVLGMVQDKDSTAILRLLPEDAYYFFTQPAIPRALEAAALAQKAQEAGLKGEQVATVSEALAQALSRAQPDDLIYVGGSTFVVAEVI